MPLIRRVAPSLVAMELIGTQPLSGPVGVVFSQRVRYAQDLSATGGPAANEEASGENVYHKYSLISAGDSDVYTASDARTNAQITSALESQGGYELNLEMVKKTVEAKTRKLQAKWTIEASQDAASMHGVDIESEMIAALSDEITREMDREVLNRLSGLAGTVRAYDFANADGRYHEEKFVSLAISVSDLSNQIAVKTKRGGASWIVVSPDLLTALRHTPAFVSATVAGVVAYGNTMFAGTINGTIRVYVDIYATTNTMLLGYKGSSELDGGLVYAPYVGLMTSQVITDPTTYDPRVSLMTRYDLVDFVDTATDLGDSADYYARGTVANLELGYV